jgi:hypothetical protein
MLPRSTSSCALAFAFLGMSFGGSARADDAADTAAARLLADDGIDLAEAGNCQQAIEKLRRAEELHHAPTTATPLGECEIAVGKLVMGTERLRRLLREPLPPGAPAPFVEAVIRARGALERALPRIPTMRIDVKVPPGVKVQVSVDGESLPDAVVGNDRPTDPGRHTIEASAPGFRASTRRVDLKDGETAKVTLELVPAPVIVEESKEHAEPASPAARTHASSASSAGAIVAMTLGGVGLVTGIVSGVTVAVDSGDLSRSCSADKRCPADKQSELSAAKAWATASTVGFVVAGAGLGTGLILLLAGRGEPGPPTEGRLHPVLGPLYAGCAGSF